MVCIPSILVLAASIAFTKAAPIIISDQTIVQILMSGQTNSSKITTAATGLLENDRLTSMLENLDSRATLFAPTDSAIEAFASNFPDIIDRYNNDAVFRENFLSYHIVPDQGFVPQTLGSVFLNTADSGLLLRADIVPTGDIFRNVKITLGTGVGVAAAVTDYIIAANGIIYIIDAVLLQPTPLSVTLANLNMTRLAVTLDDANLTTVFDNLVNITVFAPSDIAIGEFSDLLAFNNVTPTIGFLSGVSDFHVVPTVLTSSAIIADQRAAAMAGALPLNYTTGLFNETVIVSIDELTRNISVTGESNASPVSSIFNDVIFAGGILHVINGVLLPSQSALVDAQNLNETILPQFIPSA